MSIQGQQLSFAAGSSSLDPYGYRVLNGDARGKILQLAKAFPQLRSFFTSSSLIVSAYPAALGLTGVAPFVDTYLHPATFIRSLRLAAIELRPVIMVAQPLLGADLLLKLMQQGGGLPKRLLWAAGGYYFPVSLEGFIRCKLNELGCKVTFMHSYGIAEIDHSCFAALDRFHSGAPRFRKIAADVNWIPAVGSDQLVLERNGRCVNTGDFARRVDGDWRIECNRSRLDPVVHEILESWEAEDWQRRTGYLHANADQLCCQMRETVDEESAGANDVHFHEFWHRYGGSFATKPKWKLHGQSQPEVRLPLPRHV